MLAVITPAGTGYEARFERHFKQSSALVWAMLTDNEKLALWFDELRARELRKGGAMSFDLQNGEYETMEILAYVPPHVLEYTWGDDRVRFELHAEGESCKLLLIETLNKITDHTPKDLAGWHVCLEVINGLLNHDPLDSRMDAWKGWFEKYKLLLAEL